MKVLLYGGTFDPPHNGHMNNLKAAMDLVQPDKVIVMPAGTPPHKNASRTAGEVRLEMCGCFRALGPQVEVWDWELRQEGKSFTINTLRMLQEKFPGAKLYLTVGSDMLETFCSWREWEQLLQLAVLVVESREDGDMPMLYAAAQKLEQAGGQIVFASVPAVNMSSTRIRSGQAGQEAVPPLVWETMKKYQLYQ